MVYGLSRVEGMETQIFSGFCNGTFVCMWKKLKWFAFIWLDQLWKKITDILRWQLCLL